MRTDAAPAREPAREPDVIAALPPLPPAPSPPPAPTFWLDLGLFSDPDEARSLMEELLKLNLDVAIVPVQLMTAQPGVRWTRVRVGPFANRELAAATQRQLERRGYAPFLATEQPRR